MSDHDPTADDWRARIIALTGGDTIEAMLAWAANQSDGWGWETRIAWKRPTIGYQAIVYADPLTQRSHTATHLTDPAEALAGAILAAVAMGEGRA